MVGYCDDCNKWKRGVATAYFFLTATQELPSYRRDVCRACLRRRAKGILATRSTRHDIAT